jgi:uncharacterized damage-inducible protein DinB
VRSPDHFRLMAGYNRWMNEKLYTICGKLSDEERKGDRAWLGRFTGRPLSFRSLDEELYADFGELRRERASMDAEIEEFCRDLTEERLSATIEYATTAGKRYSHPLAPALVHLFNHQTHHRGQVTTLLSQLGIDPGATDVIAYYRESA